MFVKRFVPVVELVLQYSSDIYIYSDTFPLESLRLDVQVTTVSDRLVWVDHWSGFYLHFHKYEDDMDDEYVIYS